MTAPQTALSPWHICCGERVTNPGDAPSPGATATRGPVAAPTSPTAPIAEMSGPNTTEAILPDASGMPRRAEGSSRGRLPAVETGVGQRQAATTDEAGGTLGEEEPPASPLDSSAFCSICQKTYTGWTCPHCGWW